MKKTFVIVDAQPYTTDEILKHSSLDAVLGECPDNKIRAQTQMLISSFF